MWSENRILKFNRIDNCETVANCINIVMGISGEKKEGKDQRKLESNHGWASFQIKDKHHIEISGPKEIDFFQKETHASR